MIVAVIDGYRAARRLEIEVATHQARLTAVLHRYPRNRPLPTLDQLLKPAVKKQSSSDMLAAFQEMQAAGAPIKIRKIA